MTALYYQPAFKLLMERLSGRLNKVLIDEPQAFRKDFLTRRFGVHTRYQPEDAWPIAKEYLDAIENHMADTLRRHSVFFWLHMYRRIGVMLSSRHEDSTDERTVALVRQTTEMAIFKFGSLTTPVTDIARSDRINPDRILGGWMRRAVKSLNISRPSRSYRALAALMKDNPQLVLTDFSEEDFVGIHRVEGLAYQYWRAGALLRSIGKGRAIEISDDGNWRYDQDLKSTFLIESIDRRTSDKPWESSHLGVWFDRGADRKLRESPENIDDIIAPVYNTRRVNMGTDFWAQFGLGERIDMTTNFLPGLFNVANYLGSHSFLSPAFQAKYGYGLADFVAVLWAIANIFNFPRTYFTAADDSERLRRMGLNLLNSMSRGYLHLEDRSEELVAEIRRRLPLFSEKVNVGPDQISSILDRLTLTPERQSSIGLWSGGPRYLFIPFGFGDVLDLHSMPELLANLFVGLEYPQDRRGPAFEEVFRQALLARGFGVDSKELHALDEGVKELDAGVRIGSELFLFECVSIARPLDYEIGRPATILTRNRRLDGKVMQVLDLARFLREHPKGRNYDFSGVSRFVPFVVSPFEEWIWDTFDRLWEADPAVPRILSANEAIDMLEKRRQTTSTPDIA